MSGLKYSKIEIEKEMRDRQEALNKIGILQAIIESQREKIKEILNGLSEGVKNSFTKEIQNATDWQRKSIPTAPEEANSKELNSIVETLQRRKEEGDSIINTLIDIKEVRRDKKARELIERKEGLESEFSGIRELLKKWRPKEEKEFVDSLKSCISTVEKEDFIKAEELLDNIKQKITQIIKEVSLLEEQDRQRRYVLSALREVCRDLGWGEEEEPKLEVADTPESAIIYRVKSYSAGEITFRLSLQDINVDSPISKDVCYKDFDTLSDKLKRFGVHTKFERIAPPDELPELKQRGELDLPDPSQEIEREK